MQKIKTRRRTYYNAKLKMSIKQKKFNLRIPHDTTLIFSNEKKTLTVIGSLATKSMKLKLKVTIDETQKILSVSPLAFFHVSNAEKKRINALRAATVAQISHLFIESSATLCQKLKIVGVGYKVDLVDESIENLLTLKLGYSHFFYVKVPKDLRFNCFTKTKFSIFGNSYNEICQLASKIRGKKIPEPYKGKGILYENETLILKEGKKI
jgi:large subunit ribosomal protein L6